ncbi:GNAT family N-acetyltransferase [Aquipuribacter nitratireducens]|uniref:GNAT family N-acetyltransferase n=1 Tax=Aquipuribacter nitratireducens TaxID=650104 RepID=A0ABW0GRE5_9MICO
MTSPLGGGAGADRSVRPARDADVPAIGAVHARSWTGPYASLLPPRVVEALGAAALAEAWRDAVLAPPSPAHTVHVAVGDGIVAGFAAAAPVPDDPAAVELVALEVDPLHTRQGHGSRLLAAVADTSRARGVERLEAWVHVDDAPRRAFLQGAGFAPDGARRRRALAGGDGTGDDSTRDDDVDARTVWPEVRLSAWLEPA